MTMASSAAHTGDVGPFFELFHKQPTNPINAYLKWHTSSRNSRAGFIGVNITVWPISADEVSGTHPEEQFSSFARYC